MLMPSEPSGGCLMLAGWTPLFIRVLSVLARMLTGLLNLFVSCLYHKGIK